MQYLPTTYTLPIITLTEVSHVRKLSLWQDLEIEIFPTCILVRVNEFNNVAKSPLEEWVNYLKNGVIDADTKAPGLQEARKKLKYYEMSDEELHAYEEHLNAIMIQNDVLSNAKLEGRAEGRAEEKKAIAQSLLSQKVPAEIIAQATGLSIEEIQKL